MKLRKFYDHLFKLSSILVSVLTFALSFSSFFIFLPFWDAFALGGVVGLAFGVYIAYVLYVKFREEGNILGLLVAGTIMASFYIMPGAALFQLFKDNNLKNDAVYQLLLTKKSTTHYNQTEVLNLEAKLNSLKQTSFKEIAQVKDELKNHIKNEDKIKDKYLEVLNQKKYLFKDGKYILKDGKKVKANDGVYTGIWKALKLKGYSINGIESVATAQYQDHQAELEAKIKKLESLVDTKPIAKLEAKLEALSLKAIEKSQRKLDRQIHQRIALSEQSIGWTEHQAKVIFFIFGLFFEIFLNSASFWLATFSGISKRLNLLSSAHLEVSTIEVEEVRELDPLANARELLKILCDKKFVLKSLKQINAVHEKGRHAGKPLALNQAILGMTVATIEKTVKDFNDQINKNYFTEIKWDEVYKFTKADEKVPVKIGSKIYRYQTFGGHPKPHMQEARKQLQKFNPLSLKFEDLLSILEKK